MKKYIIIILTVMSSCSYIVNTEDLKDVITGIDSRYWSFRLDDCDRYPTYYLFDRQGGVTQYSQNDDGKLTISGIGCEEVEYKDWKLKGDTLYIGVGAYRIVSFNDSTIVAQDENSLVITFHRVDDIKKYAQSQSLALKRNMEKIKNISYDFVVSSCKRTDTDCSFIGKDNEGKPFSVKFGLDEDVVFHISKGDTLVKKKGYVLMNVVKDDSVVIASFWQCQDKLYCFPLGYDSKCQLHKDSSGVWIK